MEQPLFKLCYKNVKRLSIRKRPGEPFIVTAPLGTKKEVIQKFLEECTPWIKKVLAKEENIISEKEPTPEECKKFYDDLPNRYGEWQRIMGLYPRKVTVKWMSTRWGSCSKGNGHISLSFKLANVKEELQDYVMVHELAHLVHANHSADFWALVAKYIPDWKRRRDTLNRRNGLNPYCD